MSELSVFKRSESDEDKVGRFVAGSSVAFMATLFTGTMAFLWTIIMQWMLGPEGYGLAKPFMDMFWLLSTAVSFGVPHAIQTFVSHHHQSDPAESSRVMMEGTRLLFILAVVFCVPAAGAAMAFKSQMSHLMWGFTLLMAGALFGRQMYLAIFSSLGGYQRLELSSLCNIVFPVVMLISSAVMIKAVRGMGVTDLDSLVLAGVSGITIGTAGQYVISLLIMNRGGIPVKEMFAWQGWFGGTRRLLNFGKVTAVALIAGSSISFITPAAVSFLAHKFGLFGADYTSNAVNAGYFASGYTYAMAPMLIVGMIFALLPAISEAQAQGNRKLMQRYFDLAIRYAMTIIFFVFTIYFAYGGVIVQTFSGPKFPAHEVGNLTRVLVVGMSTCMIMMLMTNMLMGLKKPGAAAVVTTVTLLLEVAALAAAAKIYGDIMAAAVAFVAAVFVGVAVMVIYTLRVERLTWSWSIMARTAAAAVATSVVLHFLPAQFPVFLVWMALAAPVYFVILGIIGGLNGDDFDMVREMLKTVKLGFLSRVCDVVEKILKMSPLYASGTHADKPVKAPGE